MAVLKCHSQLQTLVEKQKSWRRVERQRVETLFQEMGLAPEAIELRGHSPSLEEHLAAYNDIDIALDTFPYTGCTTTADALWMGVPVLTVAGESMVSRQAAAVLQGVGCESGSVVTKQKMVEQAMCLANDHKPPGKATNAATQQVACEVSCWTMPAWQQAWRAHFEAGGCDGWSSKTGPPMPNEDLAPNQQPNICSTLTPVTNSVASGYRCGWVLFRMRSVNGGKPKGQRVVPIENLQPLGRSRNPYLPNNNQGSLAWLENGASEESQRWWQHTYPQLVWEPEGPNGTAMKLLLVHQNFPGQFRDLGPALCDRGHELKAIGSSQRLSQIRALKCCVTSTISVNVLGCIPKAWRWMNGSTAANK